MDSHEPRRAASSGKGESSGKFFGLELWHDSHGAREKGLELHQTTRKDELLKTSSDCVTSVAAVQTKRSKDTRRCGWWPKGANARDRDRPGCEIKVQRAPWDRWGGIQVSCLRRIVLTVPSPSHVGGLFGVAPGNHRTYLDTLFALPVPYMSRTSTSWPLPRYQTFAKPWYLSYTNWSSPMPLGLLRTHLGLWARLSPHRQSLVVVVFGLVCC